METEIANYPLIFLAAGKSSRMGFPKGLLRRSDTFWLEEQLMGFSSVGRDRVVIVLCFQSEVYFEKLPWLEDSTRDWTHRHGLGVRTIVNERPERGPFSSLQAGARKVLQLNGQQGALFCP